jgi:hypothetical protein
VDYDPSLGNAATYYAQALPFSQELERLLNAHSQEQFSNTPDFILAEFLTNCLTAWNDAVRKREKWYGVESNGATMRVL